MPELDRRQFLATGGMAAVALALTACAAKDSWVDAQRGAIAGLRKQLKGTVLVPGDGGFLDASQPTNGRYRDTVPMLVAQVADEHDVVTCVKWAREHGIRLVARGGGHNYAGLSTTTGLIVDLSRLNAVSIDPRNGIMVTGGAALNRDIFRASVNGSLLLPGGTCLSVGVGGLTLGGGIGYHTRWAGLTADHLLSTRVVTASGDVIEASRANASDLHWACRGGAGGSFGINTQFRYDLVPIPAGDIIYFRFDWRGADAALAMFSALDTLEQHAPPQLCCSAMGQATPIGGDGPRAAIDVMLRGQFLGSMKDFRDLIAPVLAAATPVKQTIVAQPFWETARIFTTEEAAPHSWADISRYTDRALPSQVIAKLVDLLVRSPRRTESDNGQIWMLGWIGGAVVDRFAPSDTAYVHRHMKNMIRPSPVWSNAAPAAVGNDLMAWTDEVIAVLAPHTPARSYQNFPNLRIKDWPRQYYGGNLERLVEVKARYDKDDVFHTAQSIPTSLAPGHAAGASPARRGRLPE